MAAVTSLPPTVQTSGDIAGDMEDLTLMCPLVETVMTHPLSVKSIFYLCDTPDIL